MLISKRPTTLLTLLLSLFLLPSLTGCASQALLKEYEDEIVSLREKLTGISKENQGLEAELARKERDIADINYQSTTNIQPAAAIEQPDSFVKDGIKIDRQGGLTVITIPSSITFPSGSAELSTNGKNAIRDVARELERNYAGMIYWIEGHTDNDQPTKSNFKSNRDLSLQRSMNVLRHLVDACDIPDSQCVAVGHGEYEPVVANTSPANKAKNRRVEIVIHPSN